MIGYGVTAYFNVNFSKSVFVIFEAMLVFRLFSAEKVRLKNNKFIKFISKYSLGIYLIHPFWINIMYKGIGIFPDILPTILGEIVFFVGIFSLSTITSIILYRLPWIRKMI